MKQDKTIRFLGCPIYKKIIKAEETKKYFLGICYNKKVYTKQLNVCYRSTLCHC